jgi:protein-disulfide isomerase
MDKYPGDVKLVIKHFPLRNHKFAHPAAIATLAADRQGKFWEFHAKVYENQKSLSDAKVQEIAQDLGMNIKQFNLDRKDPSIQGLVKRDVDNGFRAGIRGTPTIFVNGKLLRNRSLQGFEQMIEAELKKKGASFTTKKRAKEKLLDEE